ncbi:unnamed protein product [Heterobilharzia americana]|nr:unnamed protein product [Heterobilharzia americana]
MMSSFRLQVSLCVLFIVRIVICYNNICDLESEPGICRAYFKRYFYNKSSGECEKFVYGGCEGNANNFQTLEECLRTCETNRTGRPLTTQSICYHRMDEGPCRAMISRYFYNVSAQKCMEFKYGGCGGNRNNFETQENCETTCRKSELFNRNDCKLPSETGICRGYITRYYYNVDTSTCEKFIYGGCLGNENNFESLEECQLKCEIHHYSRTDPSATKPCTTTVKPRTTPTSTTMSGGGSRSDPKRKTTISTSVKIFLGLLQMKEKLKDLFNRMG